MRFSFKRYRDLILGVCMLALSVFYLIFAQQIKTRPKLTPSYASARIVPVLLGILLAILAVLLIVQGIRKLRSGQVEEKSGRVDTVAVIETFAVIILYLILLPNAGFILSTILFLFLLINVLCPNDKRKVVRFLIISIIFTAIVFVAFRILLSQMLPRGPIEALLGY